MTWWFNELGMRLHLKCGSEGRYTVAAGRHYISCDRCRVTHPAPAPGPAYAHFTYGRT